jgi:hypothetical protein
LTGREGAEFLHHLAKRARREREAMRMMIPPSTEHVSEVWEQRRATIQLRMIIHPNAQLPRSGTQRFF